MEDPSPSSSDCERCADALRGEIFLLFDRVLLSARGREPDEPEELVCCMAVGGGWVVRAREERRGVMAKGARNSRRSTEGRVSAVLRGL